MSFISSFFRAAFNSAPNAVRKASEVVISESAQKTFVARTETLMAALDKVYGHVFDGAIDLSTSRVKQAFRAAEKIQEGAIKGDFKSVLKHVGKLDVRMEKVKPVGNYYVREKMHLALLQHQAISELSKNIKLEAGVGLPKQG